MSAAFGVGGATISTPGIRALGASAFVAVGTTLPSIIPSAVSGTLRYMREGLVDWEVVKWAAPVGVATSVLGSLLSHVVPGNGHWLMIATALVCVCLFAIPGTVTHASLGDVDWRFALLLCVGVIPGARIGAVLAIRADRLVLRRAVALFLGAISVVYLVGEIKALVR